MKIDLLPLGKHRKFNCQLHEYGELCTAWLVAWYSGRTSVFGQQAVPVLRSTCS